MTDTANDDLLIRSEGPIGLITLNRPRALNALTTDMCHRLLPVLQQWGADDRIAAVVIEGAGDKAFCAGGDVVALWQGGKDTYAEADPNPVAAEFFFSEYRVNRTIEHFPKPFIALIDGISMGGGFGLSAHGSHRICTERTLFAMPETGIGLFPDVGGSWILPRCPGEVGIFLGLVGHRCKAADTLYATIGTDHVPSDKLGALKAALIEASYDGDAFQQVDRLVAGFATDPGPAPLAEHRALIDRCFGFDRMEEIIAALAAEAGEFAADTLQSLQKMSPTACKVSLAAMRKGAAMDSFDAVMIMEYRVAQARMALPDFYEGIRAQLIDKDRTPKWSPATLAAVDDGVIARHFEPQARELDFN